MGVLLRSIAPSATIMTFSLFFPARFYREGGVVERKHDRKTQTAAVTWAFRSMVARRCKNGRRTGKRTDLNL